MATVKASNQITLLDVTDAYTVVLSNESHTFSGSVDAVSGTQNATTTVYAYRKDEQVTAVVGTMDTPTGISAVSDGATPAPTITITATSAVTEGGAFEIPITINGEVTVYKIFSYSVAYTGTSITKVTNYYLASSKSSGVTRATSGWTTDPTASAATMTSTLRYLWNYEIVTYSDGSTSVTDPALIGVYGATGATGATGSTGVGIKSITEHYAVSSSNSTAPTTWYSEVQTMTATNKYLWNYETITYTDSSTESTDPRVIGVYGDKGDTGETGASGEDAITLVITSSAGLIFKNTAIATTLTAHVYKAGAELSSAEIAEIGTIKWYKDGSTTASGTGQTLTITAGNVSNSASYVAQLED